MNFNEKLQELRKQKGITQDELAKALFVSRTAVSKWESGRGYPAIDSLKNIASFYGVSVDELLSKDELYSLAEESRISGKKHLSDLAFGLADVSSSLLFVLPLFAQRNNGSALAVSFFSMSFNNHAIKYILLLLVTASVLCGVFRLACQNYTFPIWEKIKNPLSLFLSLACILLFVLGLHPYAAIFAFVLLAIKTLVGRN